MFTTESSKNACTQKDSHNSLLLAWSLGTVNKITFSLQSPYCLRAVHKISELSLNAELALSLLPCISSNYFSFQNSIFLF